MKNKFTYLILVLLLMIASFFGGSYFEKQKIKSSPNSPTPLMSPIQKLTVIEVSDGDTLKLSDGKTFRLYGVNAPEVKEPYLKKQKRLLKIQFQEKK